MTETLTGRTACVLLALVWFVSMGVGDANAYSYVPLLAGLAVVVLLALSAMIRGAKVVRLSATAWVSLGIGVYFLVRCLCSFSVVESWREASIILGCGVFYVAGVYAAQGRSLRTVGIVLAVAVALNVIYWCLMQQPDVPMEWAGRPAVGPGSFNHRPVTLFVYKNHAGGFLMMGGMLLAALALWARGGAGRVGVALLAVVAMGLSGQCGTRSIYLLAPLLLVGMWLMSVVIKLYSDQKLGVLTILSGFVLLGGIGVAVCGVLFDPEVLDMAVNADSHDRFVYWRECLPLLHRAPWWGYGADSVQWLLLPVDTLTTCTINYAHNEYLQAWMDYGLIGLGGVVAVLGLHGCRAFRVLASERVPYQQRVLTALAFLCLFGWAAAAFVDFFWHHFAIAGMTAFAAGVLASPYADEERKSGRVRKVGLQSYQGKGVLALMGVGVLALCACLASRCYPAWRSQWEFGRLSADGVDETGDARHEMLKKLVPQYPASELMDTYFRIPRSSDDWETEVRLLECVLAANPHQLYTVTMLGKMLSDHGQYERAERLYRRYYVGDGMESVMVAEWSGFYALNLLRWGHWCTQHGDVPGGYSRMCYALRIIESRRGHYQFDRLYRSDEKVWETDGHFLPYWGQYVENRKQDVKVLRLLGTPADDSWQAPMEQGGKPSLYRRYGAPESLENGESGSQMSPMAPKV